MGDGMQLWGWLDQGESDPLAGKPLAEALLCQMTGLAFLESTPPKSFDPGTVRASRLSKSVRNSLAKAFGVNGYSIDAGDRVRLSLGQSYPDQIQRRAGHVVEPADAVIRPASLDEAALLLTLAGKHGFTVTAVGGASNVVGAFDIGNDTRPRVIADMTRMKNVVSISKQNQTVTAEAGILLPDLETALAEQGLTLGHFPQSFNGATLGGSIACNGAGQRSDAYGRIADNLISASLATPSGIWTTEPFRQAAVGPWLGGLVAGSEGLFGLICSATLRLHPAPEMIEDRAWFFPSFQNGCEAVKSLAQDGHAFAMLRLSDESETHFLSRFRLAMAGHIEAPLMQQLALKLKRAPTRPALLIAGFEGPRAECNAKFNELGSRLRSAGGIALGKRPGASWRRGRYELPYLRESLMRRGIGVDTFETAVPWGKVNEMRHALRDTLEQTIASTMGRAPGKTSVMCHLSHSYPEGACLYFTAIFPRGPDAASQWRVIKEQVLACIAAHAGTASHHHGVGADHAQRAGLEKGDLALSLMKALKHQLDPQDVLISGSSRMF